MRAWPTAAVPYVGVTDLDLPLEGLLRVPPLFGIFRCPVPGMVDSLHQIYPRWTEGLCHMESDHTRKIGPSPHTPYVLLSCSQIPVLGRPWETDTFVCESGACPSLVYLPRACSNPVSCPLGCESHAGNLPRL